MFGEATEAESEEVGFGCSKHDSKTSVKNGCAWEPESDVKIGVISKSEDDRRVCLLLRTTWLRV